MTTSFKLGLLALALAATASLAEDSPKIQFDRSVYDFGTTALVESVTGTFTYQNTGTGVLRLEKPRPSCGCTVAKVSPETLKPGEKGELVFTIALGTSAIRLAKEIFVSSNDPQTPVVQLGIKVATKAVLQAQPAGVNFGDVTLGAMTNQTFLVKRLDGKKLTIEKIEATSESVSAKIEPETNPSSQSIPVSVTVKAAGRPRHLSAQLRIYTDDSQGAGLIVFVSARFLGDLKLEPEALTWGMPDPEHWNDPNTDVILSRSLRVSATQTGTRLVIRNLSCDIKDIKLTLETLEKDRSYQIEATLPSRLKESVRGTISFETNLPSLPKVEIPLEINVWKK